MYLPRQNIHSAKQILFPEIKDVRGNLSFFENNNQLPFAIKRTYWIFDVPSGETRGGHAFVNTEEVIVALSGSFDLVLKDGANTEVIRLSKSSVGVYVPNMIWRSLENFSTNALALIVSNTQYNSSDYIRDYDYYKILND